MIQAIVYTSNTGSTERYAKLLGHELELPVYSLDEAKKALKCGPEIIYLGWIMAGTVQGYREAEKRYQISMVCAVGMEPAGTQLREIREKNRIPDDVELFTLQGGYLIHKLRGVHKLMMLMVTSTAGKALAEKIDRTPEEDDLLELMEHGGSRVSVENLAAPIQWCQQNLGGVEHE